jgi:hypothetical protein
MRCTAFSATMAWTEHRDERLAILAADARGEPAECLASETTFEILRGQMCGCRVD